MKTKNCKKCEVLFLPKYPAQTFCGSREEKIGCSWERHQKHDYQRKIHPGSYLHYLVTYYGDREGKRLARQYGYPV